MFAYGGLTGEQLFGGFSKTFVGIDGGENFQVSSFYKSSPICIATLVEPFAKLSFRPNSALCSKFYPRNISYMPVVKFFACLDFDRKSYFCKRL